MIAVMVGTMRAGLLPRWLSVLGIVAGVLFLPFSTAPTLQLIPTFWLVATGILLMGRLPNGDPPAWAAGEARPWPTQAECARSAKRRGRCDRWYAREERSRATATGRRRRGAGADPRGGGLQAQAPQRG